MKDETFSSYLVAEVTYLNGTRTRTRKDISSHVLMHHIGVVSMRTQRNATPTLDHQNLGLKTHNRGETTSKTGQCLA